jgi:hypothetical protein
LHGEQRVQKDKHVPIEDLEGTGTSLATPDKVMASEEYHVVPTNSSSPFHNQFHIQSGENKTPAHYNVLPSGMDGIHAEVNAPVLGVGSINAHDPPRASLQEVAINQVASALIQ